MKKTLFIILLFTRGALFAQDNYWQQQLHYTINTELNEKEKSLAGSETIVYKNNSPATLDFIWFHIWPNAYKNSSTALMQQIKNDPDRKSKLDKYDAGFIDGLAFTVNGKSAVTEAHPNPAYIDIIKLILPRPLKAGDSVNIQTPFKVQLPSYFSRSGFADGEFMVCQWYPKPAVFDKDGWHEFPYLDMGEFYSEYASFDVNIKVPSNYVVSATGTLQNADELALYKSIGAKNVASRDGQPALYKPIEKSATKTLRFTAANVPDFAWFADKGFIIQYDTVQLGTGKIIDAFSYYHNRRNTTWNNSIDYIKDGVKKYSGWIGEYEYPVVQAVEGPKNNSSGGMEYPMVTLITSPDAKIETLDGVIAHEVGHNWFMSMLGSNERAHTWMDEGLNTYFQFRYEAEKYRTNSIFGNALPASLKALPADKFLELVYQNLQEIPMQTAMETSAEKFTGSQEYGLISYIKTAVWVYLLESEVGREKVDKAFQHYFTKWKDKHPQPADLKAAFEESLGTNLDKYFDLINKQGKF
ncbi:MAG: peptidase [Ferruginibacter sp.]|nr:peptidase [Ferruginibacter sp.]